MTKGKCSKKALLTSLLAVVMCVAMLVGTTFAWFTDTASTGVNKIQAGNLNVKLEYATGWDADGKPTAWANAEGETLQFRTADGRTTNILWEPGCRYQLPELRVVNDGNLALKYKVAITGIQGSAKLNRVIDWTIQNDADAAATDLDATEYHLAAKGTENASDVITIKGVMQTTAGNEYQNESIDGISVTVYATQDNVENDSFDNSYDEDATYYPVIDAAGLKDALTNGGNVSLAKDVAVVPEVDTSVENYRLFEQMTVTKDTTLDLSGKKIAFDVADGTDYAKACPLLMSVAGGTLTINGDGEINCDAAGNNAYGINVNGGNVVINGGKYYGAITAIQVKKGSLEINGGFFDMTDDCKATVPQYAKYIINCIDSAYKDGTAEISVKGGTFVNFDPSDNPEGAGTTYVADGYAVISDRQADGDVWYTVVKGAGAAVGTQEEMNEAITANSEVTVKLTKAGTYKLSECEMSNKNITITGTKDTVIDIPTAVAPHNSTIIMEGVTVKSPNSDYTGLQHTSAVTFKNCAIEGQPFLYAKDAQYIGCTFTQTSSGSYNVWTYGAENVLFKDCTFNCAGKSVLIYREHSAIGQTVEFQNCKFNASTPVSGKAAIEIDSSLLLDDAKYTVVIDKATADNVNGFAKGSESGNSVWNNKKGEKATVIVDGKTVLSAN